jgi:hypothetical protein
MNAPPSAYQIERAMKAAGELLAQVREDDIADDHALLGDLLDGQTNVLDVARTLIRASIEADGYADAIEARIKALRERKARFQKRHDAARQAAFAMLEELGLPDLTDAEFTVSRRQPAKPPLVIVDEEGLPDDLCRIKREPDKASIRAALEAGTDLDGKAMLGNAAPVWTVR